MLHSTAEVARRLGVSPRRVLQLAKVAGVGRYLNRQAMVFTDAEIEILRDRVTRTGPRKKGEVRMSKGIEAAAWGMWESYARSETGDTWEAACDRFQRIAERDGFTYHTSSAQEGWTVQHQDVYFTPDGWDRIFARAAEIRTEVDADEAADRLAHEAGVAERARVAAAQAERKATESARWNEMLRRQFGGR